MISVIIWKEYVPHFFVNVHLVQCRFSMPLPFRSADFFYKENKTLPPIRKHPQCASTKRGAEGCHISQQGCLCVVGGDPFFRNFRIWDSVIFFMPECAVSQHFRHFWSVRVQHLSIHPSIYRFGISLIPTLTLSFREGWGWLELRPVFPPLSQQWLPSDGSGMVVFGQAADRGLGLSSGRELNSGQVGLLGRWPPPLYSPSCPDGRLPRVYPATGWNLLLCHCQFGFLLVPFYEW